MALTGKFRETPFADLVQFYAASKQTVAVTVTLPDSRSEDGIFYIEDGDVVDAWLGEAVGREAFRRAMHLADGSFRIEPDIRAAERTIPESLPQLLLEETVRLGAQRMPERPVAASTIPPAAPNVPRAPGGASRDHEGASRPSTAPSQLPPVPPRDPAAPAKARSTARPTDAGALRRARKTLLVVAAAVAAALIVAAILHFARAGRMPGGSRKVTRPVGDGARRGGRLAADRRRVNDARPPFTTPCVIAATIRWPDRDGPPTYDDHPFM